MATETTPTVGPFALHVPDELRPLIEEAALCLGQSVDDFAAAALAQRARDIVRQHRVIELSNHDRDRLLELLDEGPEPNDALRAAAKEYGGRLE